MTEAVLVIKCCACGADCVSGQEACETCGSGNLLDRRRYLRRALAVSVLIAVVAILVAAMVYGELHRGGATLAIGA